jgi:hypothetical protein
MQQKQSNNIVAAVGGESIHRNNPQKQVDSTPSSKGGAIFFELPNIPDDDLILVENILKVVKGLGTKDVSLCVKYKVDIIQTGYLLRAVLPATDVYEVDLEDLLFIQSVSPSRIERVCIAKSSSQQTEIIIKILDYKQKIMVTSVTSFSATRKRKFTQI